MEVVKSLEDISKLSQNKVMGSLLLKNSEIIFDGEDNLVVCDGNLHFVNTTLRFSGNHALMYFACNSDLLTLHVRCGHDSIFFLGKNSSINKEMHVYATERKHVIIGNDCLLSHDIYFRTADPHLIYDIETKKRINDSKSIFVGDHVWIGQGCLILKNTKIGSGSIIGGHSVVSSKEIPSNSMYAGNPVRGIKENIFFTRDSVHDYTKQDSHKKRQCSYECYIYHCVKEEKLSFKEIDKTLSNMTTSEQKARYIKETMVTNEAKNRFFIQNQKTSSNK